MLRSTKDLEHYEIDAPDGDLGHIKDFYFDDDAWVVRYLVLDTGSWLSGRRVLISPISIREPDTISRKLRLSITKEQVSNSPDIDTDRPVSRQSEGLYLGYYGYAGYWGGLGMWGNGLYPYTMSPGYLDMTLPRQRDSEEQAYRSAQRERRLNEDPHLRSCKEVVGYHLHASDGEIGHVTDFLMDDETWAIRYLVVDTSNWWIGHKVLIATSWLEDVSWGAQTVSVNLSRESVKAAPTYQPADGLSLEREVELYKHYDRTWYGTGMGMSA
jgi:uncharacterized protein YrrD